MLDQIYLELSKYSLKGNIQCETYLSYFAHKILKIFSTVQRVWGAPSLHHRKLSFSPNSFLVNPSKTGAHWGNSKDTGGLHRMLTEARLHPELKSRHIFS